MQDMWKRKRKSKTRIKGMRSNKKRNINERILERGGKWIEYNEKNRSDTRREEDREGMKLSRAKETRGARKDRDKK